VNHFLALRPAAHVRDRLAEVAARLRAWELPARWVHPEDYHCTLCFLGHLDDDEARVLPRAVDEVAGSLEAPPLTLDGLGAFGGKRMPRTVFAALGDPEEALAGYHHDLAQAAEEPPERRFRPHLTLARPTGSGEPGRDWPDLRRRRLGRVPERGPGVLPPPTRAAAGPGLRDPRALGPDRRATGMIRGHLRKCGNR